MPQGELDETQAAEPSSDPARTHTQPRSATDVKSGELPAGLSLGHFRIERKLGAGGMGEVYLATDVALDRPVAIKVLPAGAASGAARERLIREARAQARIHHPNVAHIYFIGEDNGRLYFAMEYIVGKTLAERVATGAMSVEDSLALIRGAVLGLREAQRAGFMHRDVKPSNLMVDAHGMVKVLDFGLVAAAPQQADGPVAQTSLAGTPLYMAPEQALGEAIDLRADIYALGATLYHLVSGRPPFQADSVAELVTLHASAERPAVPRGANPLTAIRAIDRLIARMMAPSPADRFATYDELLRAIEGASAEHSRPAGFWVRSIATAVDLAVIATLLALGKLAGILIGGAFDLEPTMNLGPLIIPVAIAATSLTLVRYGTTAGKALFELEVVGIDSGRRPSLRQAFARQIVLGTVPAVLAATSVWSGPRQDPATADAGVTINGDLVGLLVLLTTVTLVAVLLHAVMRVPGKRAPWDRLSGTQVRYRAARRDAAALLP